MNEDPSQPSLLEAEQAQLPQPFLLRETRLHSPNHPRCPPPEPSFPRPFHPRRSRLGAAALPFRPGGCGHEPPRPWQRASLPRACGSAGPGRPHLGGAGAAGTGTELGYPSGPGRSRRRRLMTRGRPVTRGFPEPRGGTASVVPKRRRFAPKPAPHGHSSSGRTTGTWPQAGTQPRALPAAAGQTQRSRGDASEPRGCGDGRGARWRPGRRRGRRGRRTGWLRVCPSSRDQLPDFQRAGCRELVPRVPDVQGLAPRHREQRAAVAAPLPGRARRLPAGDRLRPRERVFLEGKSTFSGRTPAVT